MKQNNKIVKGRKGWYATEMVTWSNEKKREMLEKYGKEGLTPNTYAWLTANSTPIQKLDTNPVQTAITKAQAEIPNYTAQYEGSLIYNIPGAEQMSNAQLQTAIHQKQQERQLRVKQNEAIDTKKREYEYQWAIKNYEALTGQKYLTGIDLSDYTIDAVKQKQLAIGLTGNEVDGKWGKMSQKTYDDYMRKFQNTVESHTQKQNPNSISIPNDEIDINTIMSDTNFADWLMNDYSKSGFRKVQNIGTVGGRLMLNLSHIPSDMNLTGDTGLNAQVIANQIYYGKPGEGYNFDKATGSYKIQDGRTVTHDSNSEEAKTTNPFAKIYYGVQDLSNRTTEHPLRHVLGAYSTNWKEDGLNIIDDYNFNESGTDYATADNTSYGKIRYMAGKLTGGNTNHINYTIPWEQVKDLYLKYIESGQQGIKLNYLSYGKSGIKIKKANKGKFTEYCGGKVTTECINRGKHSSSAAVRKRATFAANARKWKHQAGGEIQYAAMGTNITYIKNNTEYKPLNVIEKQNLTTTSASTVSPASSVESIPWNLRKAQLYANRPIVQSTTSQQTQLTQSVPVDKSKPRGYRNNNPLNIRMSSINWFGKVADNTDGAFELFDTMANGYRAAIKNLKSYIKQGNNTINKIISKWAPSNENHTSSYISHVAQATGINPNTIINGEDKDNMTKIIAAMALIENGLAADLSEINAGWEAAV